MKIFNPLYRITVLTPEGEVEIKLPITCKMSITRSTMSDSTGANIQLYNLAPSTRNKIYQDMYSNFDQEKWKYVIVEAGYGEESNMSMIFKGRILQAYSKKSGGQTDVITEIQAQALDVFDCNFSQTFAAGTSNKDIMKTIASTMTNCELGNIGNIGGTIQTATTFDGNALDQINILAGGNAFVDNGVINVLLNNECIDVPVPVISDDSVLLETPERRESGLSVKMMFMPNLIVAQLLEIKSNVFSNFNGQYKVMGFTHDLMFSKSQAGTRTTTCDLWVGTQLPNSELSVTGQTTEQKTDGTVTGGAAPVASNSSNFNKVKGEKVTPVNPQPANTKWIMPCKGVIESDYGWRIHPIYKKRIYHNGIDIKVPVGTPVKAIADGTVCVVGPAKGYGYWVGINHGIVNGIKVSSEYGHISRWVVSYGQKVKQGQTIAYSGNTGSSTGPHLHLTIREGNPGKPNPPLNPWSYITR